MEYSKEDLMEAKKQIRRIAAQGHEVTSND